MAQLLVLHILLALLLFFTVSYSVSEETRELQERADDMATLLISSRRVLNESPIQFSTSPDHSFVKTVGATAMGSLATAGVFTFFFRKCSATRRRHKSRVDSAQRINIEKLVMKQKGETMTKGSILDDDEEDKLDELDLLYWKKLESGQLARNFSKVMTVNPIGEDEVRTGFETEIPWQPYRVTAPRKLEYGLKDQVPSSPIAQQPVILSSTIAGPRAATTQPPSVPPPPPSLRGQRALAHPPPPPPPPLTRSAIRVITENVEAETKPPRPLVVSPITRASPATPASMPPVPQPRKYPAPSPATIPLNKIPAPPPPPPIPQRKAQAHLPRSPIIPVNKNPSKQTISSRPIGVKLKRNVSVKPPTIPRRRSNSISIENGFTAEDNTIVSEIKLKPLHWDKVVANTEHSMVWDEINNGSFRFDDELMVSLFGYTSSKEKVPGTSTISGSKVASSPAPAQNFILDPRKSQNIAIVLKSLSVSRKEILEALLNGEGLSSDQLEKLSTLSPTQEETMRILQFDGNPTKLATAESFLYHILKALPSAFTRIDAMLFRSIYDPEILHQKESLQTMELACKELRKSEIFVRLLEAILKAGNKLNAGTARGNAQGFHLTALKKLSDVKSINGKTTLLHFVIEQVVRSEGRRCAVNNIHFLGKNDTNRCKADDPNLDNTETKEEKDKEYLMLGLPILGGLSTELSHVKKAAAIEYDSFISVCSSLTNQVSDIKKLVTGCQNEIGGFVLEMKSFLEGCEGELKVVGDEQMRVLELVKRTTEYYQAGASREKSFNSFHLFKIIKDFLDMVDQVCVDITHKSKTKKIATANASPPSSPAITNLLKFPSIQPHFFRSQPKNLNSGDSDSEGDF